MLESPGCTKPAYFGHTINPGHTLTLYSPQNLHRNTVQCLNHNSSRYLDRRHKKKLVGGLCTDRPVAVFVIAVTQPVAVGNTVDIDLVGTDFVGTDFAGTVHGLLGNMSAYNQLELGGGEEIREYMLT